MYQRVENASIVCYRAYSEFCSIFVTVVFRESEEFESIAVVRVETLLKEAYAHKQNLEAEKQALVGRLKGVTSILEKPPVPK